MSGYERALREAVRGWLVNSGIRDDENKIRWLDSELCKAKFVDVVVDEIAQYRKDISQKSFKLPVPAEAEPKPEQKKFPV